MAKLFSEARERGNKMATITLKNSFHHTEVKLRVKMIHAFSLSTSDEGRETAGGFALSSYQVKRAKRALCGVNGCLCSNDLGLHGPQDFFDNGVIHHERDGDFSVDMDTRNGSAYFWAYVPEDTD